MKRLWIFLLALLLVAGCSSAAPDQPAPVTSQPGPAGEAPKPEPPPAKPPETKPPEPVRTEGPLYLLSAGPNPLWGGPAVVSVENSPMSRPQAGLEKADLVVELLAESEITRFLAFYWSQPAAKIGPIRSARTAFIAIADAYDAPFAHAGGSAEALDILAREWGAKNLDEIYGSWQYFYRWKEREPPHNLYTTTDLLGRAVAERKLAWREIPTSPKAEAMPAPGKEAARVRVDWHKLHQVSWSWSESRYLRVDDGEPHLLESGEQIGAVNLIFLEVQGENKGPDLGWTLFFQPGGKATVISAGHRWEGSWALEAGGFRLTPVGGKVPLLAPGSTWVHLITHESSFQVEEARP
ncbi:MAG: DUF3048 domain-containing protein [Bacillota bacterium]